jgi:hypothetical protein
MAWHGIRDTPGDVGDFWTGVLEYVVGRGDGSGWAGACPAAHGVDAAHEWVLVTSTWGQRHVRPRYGIVARRGTNNEL